VITNQPNAVINNYQPAVSPKKEGSLNFHVDEDNLDSTSQHNKLYDKLPSPTSYRPSLSFSGKKTKFMWTREHFRILSDALEFAKGIIENWKRYIMYAKICCISYSYSSIL